MIAWPCFNSHQLCLSTRRSNVSLKRSDSRGFQLARRCLMQITRFVSGACAVLLCGFAATPSIPKSQAVSTSKATPLILEKDEGERRVWRGWPGHPEPGSTFLLKIDPKNGGSSHLVFRTEDLTPGEKIAAHRHPRSDEIPFLQSRTARVHLGDSVP